MLAVVVAVGFFARAIWFQFFRKCPKCGGKLKLDSRKDSMGFNLTKKITISFWDGPRSETEYYKCEKCDYSEENESWSLS